MTGGAGFIGSHLADSLTRLGCGVTVFDNFDDFYGGKEHNIAHLTGLPKFRLERGTILDEKSLRRAMSGKSIVFHLAGQAGIRYCLANPVKAHEVNVTGTLNVLTSARHLGVQKLVFASSSSLYGVPIKVPISETHPLNPMNIYGASKLAAEKYCISFSEGYGLPVTCLRYFSVYGPRGRPDQVLYAVAQRAAAGKPAEIYGSGNQTRDFTYVSDIVSGTIIAAMRDDSIGEVFNLGYGSQFTIRDATARINRYFRNEVPPIHRTAYQGDFPRTLCDNSKARERLGWSPQVNFAEGLEAFLDWFSKERSPMTHGP